MRVLVLLGVISVSIICCHFSNRTCDT